MILFKPNGMLDVATEATDLPETTNGFDIISEAMSRCKNLRVNRKGILETRQGSVKLNSSPINTAIWLIEVMNGDRYSFAGGSIYLNESSIASGLTSAQWSAIQYNAYNDTTDQIFALNGTDRKRITGSDVNEWGIEPPGDAAVLSVGALSGLTGTYKIKYTFARYDVDRLICESNPSPESEAITVSNESIAVSVDTPDDSQVNYIRLYRTADSGSIFYYIGRWYVGHSIDDNTADTELDTAIETDHNRPPLGSVVKGPAYDGTCFIIKDNLLYYCKPKQPEYWPSLYYIEVSTPQFPGVDLIFHNGQPYFITKKDIYFIQGTGNGTFFPILMSAKTGMQGPKGAISVDGEGIYHTGPDGIYLWSGNDKKLTLHNFEPLFNGESVNGMPAIGDNLESAWLHKYLNHLYFGYRSGGSLYPENVIVFDLTTGRSSYYVYNDGSDIQIRCLANDDTNNRLLIGDSTGYIRQLHTGTQDSSTAISWEVQSKDYTLQTRAHFPRFVKYDVDASDAVTCTGELILDDVSHQSHTITGSRQTKRRLVRTGNGERAAIKLSGSGTVKIYAAESE